MADEEIHIEPFSDNDFTVRVDRKTMEPEEYFTVLKGSMGRITNEELETQLRRVASEIIRCKRLGQNVLAEKLEFAAESIVRERVLYSEGYTNFVHQDMLRENIDKVQPRGGVKLIELNRYQRFIPEYPASMIEIAREKNLFDGFLVLFTDLTGKDYASPEERQFIQRNKDPICFGYFKDEEKRTNEIHPRLYMVADWADEHCDLTWDRLVNQLPEEATGFITDEAVTDVINRVSQPKAKKWTDQPTSPLRRFWHGMTRRLRH